MTINDASRAQIDAAHPHISTWLGANAGSGKTRVLTDRVARLLLNGVNPQRILCLTYTKAAASEMQNRLFRRLGSWAMSDDGDLNRALRDLGVDQTLDADRLRQARTLFAQAIETPGGLKIQTIHSFCAALLRRFPLEARVSPQFTEIDDRAADLLRAEIVDDMADGPEAEKVAGIARFYTGEEFNKLTGRIVTFRDTFEATHSLSDVLEKLGQPRTLSWPSIEAQVFEGGEEKLLADIIPHLIAKGGNDEKAGLRLRSIDRFDRATLPLLEGVFLTGATAKSPFTAKIGSFPTKPTQKVIAAQMSALEAFILRVEDAREARLSLAAAEKTQALHDFARTFLARYEIAKEKRGWLDFDDLIQKARELLQDSAVAAWVLYRIDGGIDHILVDEAQDTSPAQWEVIEALTHEFHSGSGARQDIQRTLFVVGDKKQSIYSFQGADPLEFDRRRATFEQKFQEAHLGFQNRSLDYSFRSSSAILRLVDTVFDTRRRPEFDKDTGHFAFKGALPGRVDIWPLIEKAETQDDGHWTDPVDRRAPRHHTVILAEKIAAQIGELTDPDNPTFIPDDGPTEGTFVRRPIRYSDFLILVQRRSALFSEIIRACKKANLPIAGADRLKVGAELAVKDIAALLSYLATSDDDLSLATALKSPIFGWSEQQLFDLAHRREVKSLSQALRLKRDTYPETFGVLSDLRAQVDFLRPYDLIERILTRHDGRKKLLARLGPEAEDGINALLTQALAFERSSVPSLTGFLEWMQTDDLEIKRQIDNASNQIRVMTVHGSKGLEAPIVILPDTGKRDIIIKDEIVQLDEMPFWKPNVDEMPEALRGTLDVMKEAQRAERLRLLYVAMTRAEKWLIIAAAGDLSKDRSDWFQIADEAMGHVNAVEVGATGVRRFQEGDWDQFDKEDGETTSSNREVLDPAMAKPVPIFCHPPATLSPSELGGAKALPGELGETPEEAMAYGTLVHDLLEKLARVEEQAFHNIAEKVTAGVAPEISQRAIAEALAVIREPTLSDVFVPDALAEVPITARIGNTPLYGILDRLLVSADQVILVDYKTNRVVPNSPADCPEGILRQMGAYLAMLSDIYPDHTIHVAILWTSNASLMHLQHDLVTEALWRSPYLDAAQARS